MGKIATKSYCNTIVSGTFSNDLTKCPTKAEIIATGKLIVNGTYDNNQLVQYDDIGKYVDPVKKCTLYLLGLNEMDDMQTVKFNDILITDEYYTFEGNNLGVEKTFSFWRTTFNQLSDTFNVYIITYHSGKDITYAEVPKDKFYNLWYGGENFEIDLSEYRVS